MVDTGSLTKLYYTIGEVADMFKVNTSLIRFWEKEFSIINPKKNKKGNRLFTVKDIENFNRIFELVKVNGYTLDGAKKALRSKNASVTEESIVDNNDVLERLISIREKLLALRSK
ncbi:MAG: MerR family transcriptional regulator [Bacteroidetes bacterium]|nr:MAG: MerR family transcriptional regulator [Bacteroidota bacterium]